jgi:amino-acid N-acetyltransferase
VKIRNAGASDLTAVESLLAANDLPVDGVRDNFDSFIVAIDNDAIVGVIGLEKFDSAALLRSAVVQSDSRGSGVGRQLVEQILERAEQCGIDEVYLLTTTA